MEEKSVNHVYDIDVISFDIAQKDSYELDLKGKFEVIFREGKYYVERIKPKYPKNYEECCKVLGSDPSRIIVLSNRQDIIHEENKHGDDMYNLYHLLICRDAYWKEEGGWKPNWNNDIQFKYIITCRRDIIRKDTYTSKNCILAFPTEEMRDTFYENFKDLIEICKELL